MGIKQETLSFHNNKEQAEKSLEKYKKSYGQEGKYIIRKSPRWRTWDVIKVSKTKPRKPSTKRTGLRSEIPTFEQLMRY